MSTTFPTFFRSRTAIEMSRRTVSSRPPGPLGARLRGRPRLVEDGSGRDPGPERPAPARAHLAFRDRFIFNDLSRRSGAIVFSSSRGGEFSYESPAVENGFFTEAILGALSGAADRDGDGFIDTDELRAFVSADVAKRTAGLQNPTVDRDDIFVRFGFRLR